MLYKEFNGEKISLLGFGCMRFPTVDGKVDRELTEKMIDYAYEHGVNYFDTAFPYMNGESEEVIGNILKKYPRDSFYLATKYPGHQIKPGLESDETKPEAVFERQLKKCGVEYFDFYLLHNVCENSYDVYTDESRGILDYFVKQKELGRIKHLGFSSHGAPDNLEDFLKRYGDKLEFCQIQLNYLDWTLQKAKEKCEILQKYGKGIWVMESVRGGKLAKLNPVFEEKMKAFRPDESIAAWALRWLQDKDFVNVSLSGMSNFEQVQDNIKTYEERKPLSEEENKFLDDVAAKLASFIPCTACKYCVKECPQELDIPGIIGAYNDLLVSSAFTPLMFIEQLPEGHKPSDCLECHSCEDQCPQKIEISEIMKKCAEKYAESKTWTQVCKERFDITSGKK